MPKIITQEGIEEFGMQLKKSFKPNKFPSNVRIRFEVTKETFEELVPEIHHKDDSIKVHCISGFEFDLVKI